MRSAETDDFYRLGFDIATGIFDHPALGAQGNTSIGRSPPTHDGVGAAKRDADHPIWMRLRRRAGETHQCVGTAGVGASFAGRAHGLGDMPSSRNIEIRSHA